MQSLPPRCGEADPRISKYVDGSPICMFRVPVRSIDVYLDIVAQLLVTFENELCVAKKDKNSPASTGSCNTDLEVSNKYNI